jgi:hypothetical protein
VGAVSETLRQHRPCQLLWGPQRQTRAGYEDVKGYRRRHSLALAQSSSELLGVFGPIEYRGWEQLDEGD